MRSEIERVFIETATLAQLPGSLHHHVVGTDVSSGSSNESISRGIRRWPWEERFGPIRYDEDGVNKLTVKPKMSNLHSDQIRSSTLFKRRDEWVYPSFGRSSNVLRVRLVRTKQTSKANTSLNVRVLSIWTARTVLERHINFVQRCVAFRLPVPNLVFVSNGYHITFFKRRHCVYFYRVPRPLFRILRNRKRTWSRNLPFFFFFLNHIILYVHS